jgi:hypothetical protein
MPLIRSLPGVSPLVRVSRKGWEKKLTGEDFYGKKLSPIS